MDIIEYEEKEKEMKKDENIKDFIDRNDFGFTKIKTFDQLKAKVLEIKRDYEKTKIDVGDNTSNINVISKKLDDFIGGEGNEILNDNKNEKNKNKQTNTESSKSDIKNQISEMNKKLKFLLGGITLEDIENENQEENEQNKKKLMNFEEINRRLTKL